MIRVGRCLYDKHGKRTDPTYPGFRTIVVLTKGTNRWGAIGPYELKDEDGVIMENYWQFSKCYPKVEATKQKKSRYEAVPIWDHPSETHVIDPMMPATAANMTPEYWAWRQKGFSSPYAIRYPPGFGKMDTCIGLLAESDGEYVGPLSYVESRKRVYVPLYTRLARRSPLFAELRKLVTRGVKILIAEVDGPHQETLNRYIECYGVGAKFIDAHTVAATPANLKILLNDSLHPFGHGYCLAAALADIDLSTDDESVAEFPELTEDEIGMLLEELDG
jgi:hypothetical protein